MRGLKTLLTATTLLTAAAFAPKANAQVVIGIGIQPVCSYGYYDYAPYGCAPVGFYGPGYFHNGIFLGMGPWSGWGYSHGWGSYRFVSSGGGRYTGGGGYAANHTTVVHNTDTTVVNNNHTTVDRTYNNGGSNEARLRYSPRRASPYQHHAHRPSSQSGCAQPTFARRGSAC